MSINFRLYLSSIKWRAAKVASNSVVGRLRPLARVRVGTSRVLEAVVDSRHRYVFILNPKVGSRSVCQVLGNFQTTRCLYLNASLARELKSSGFSFWAFFRDPYERALSCYNQKFNTKDPRVLGTHAAMGIQNDLNLEEFVNFIASIAGGDISGDKHWVSQSYLLTFAGQLEIDEINLLDFSRFSANLKKFSRSMYGAEVEVPRLLETEKSGNFTDSQLRILNERYKEDVNLIESLRRRSTSNSF